MEFCSQGHDQGSTRRPIEPWETTNGNEKCKKKKKKNNNNNNNNNNK